MATTLSTSTARTCSVDAAPDTPLLWVLRDELQLTGTKYGCGIAQCGACTVHLNGQADALLPDADRLAGGGEDHHHRGPGRRAPGAGRLDQAPTCRSAATASRARSCRRRRCWRKTPKPTDDDIDRGHERQHLPLRRLPAHPRGDQGRRRRSARLSGGAAMNAPAKDPPRRPTRRALVIAAATAGGALLVGCSPGRHADVDRRAEDSTSAPSARSSASSPDGCGDGGLQAHRVRPGHARRPGGHGRRGARRRLGQGAGSSRRPANAKVYANTGMGVQGTGGSSAIANSWDAAAHGRRGGAGDVRRGRGARAGASRPREITVQGRRRHPRASRQAARASPSCWPTRPR